tara:strand:- start:530 stop:916 length:387 start_codon:yes stop_codon:yes gene_type:complete
MANRHRAVTTQGIPTCVCDGGGSRHQSWCGSSCECCDNIAPDQGRELEKSMGFNCNRLDPPCSGTLQNGRCVPCDDDARVPTKFGVRNKPLLPQTVSGTSYEIFVAGSGNTPIKNVDMFPSNSDMLMG